MRSNIIEEVTHGSINTPGILPIGMANSLVMAGFNFIMVAGQFVGPQLPYLNIPHVPVQWFVHRYRIKGEVSIKALMMFGRLKIKTVCV